MPITDITVLVFLLVAEATEFTLDNTPQFQSMQSIRKIAASTLFISEPNPQGFGNPPNAAHKTWTNKNWLKSRFHFSFAEHEDRKRIKFGVLRVLNDDLVQPQRGFGTHPHSNMEIITYVVDGQLSHKDSMGTEESLGRGSIQYMSAGTGVSHSEHNHHPTEPARFIQMWILPRASGLTPNYGSIPATAEHNKNHHNKWAHLVSDVLNSAANTPSKINQDANIYITELDQDTHLNFDLKVDRQAYLVCIEGNLNAGPETLTRHDAAEIVGPIDLELIAKDGPAHVLMIEMKKTGDTRFWKTKL